MGKLASIPVIIEEDEEYQLKRSYPRLSERFREIQMLYKETETLEERRELMMEDDCLVHVMECERIAIYEQIVEHVKHIGAKRAIDIGCAYGHQSEAFVDSGVDYVGVTNHDANFFNADKFTFIKGHYPCELPVKQEDVGISVLCLTWNCYLIEGEKTLHEQCAALQRDFNDCILYMTKEAVSTVEQYFNHSKKIGQNLYHFSNSAQQSR